MPVQVHHTANVEAGLLVGGDTAVFSDRGRPGVVRRDRVDDVPLEGDEELLDVPDPTLDVLDGVERIDDPHPFRRERHELHHTHGALGGNGVALPVRFRLDDGVDERGGQIVRPGDPVDVPGHPACRGE